MIGDANNNNNSVDERIKQITITENTKEGQTSVIKLETIDSNKEIVPNPGSNIGSNSLSVNQEKAEKKESLRIVDMTMPKDWKLLLIKQEEKLKKKQEEKLKKKQEEKLKKYNILLPKSQLNHNNNNKPSYKRILQDQKKIT
jgi:hypothetical protein